MCWKFLLYSDNGFSSFHFTHTRIFSKRHLFVFHFIFEIELNFFYEGSFSCFSVQFVLFWIIFVRWLAFSHWSIWNEFLYHIFIPFFYFNETAVQLAIWTIPSVYFTLYNPQPIVWCDQFYFLLSIFYRMPNSFLSYF